jgi:RHS repeat-associated protein
LDYFLARYYSGSQSRFANPDNPLNDQSEDDPQSWNLYSYVRNNPMVSIDPTGRYRKEPADLTYVFWEFEKEAHE